MSQNAGNDFGNAISKNTLPFFEVLFSMLHSCNKLVSENIETVVGSLGGVCVNLNCLSGSKSREKPSL